MKFKKHKKLHQQKQIHATSSTIEYKTTKECGNCTVLDLGISKDRERAAKAPRVGLLNTYCAGKRLIPGWSTKLSILKKTHRDATLRLCQRSQLTLPPLYWLTWSTTRSSNDRCEVVADIQTGEQYSSTGSMNAQKLLATTATSRKTLIIFLKIPTPPWSRSSYCSDLLLEG